MPPEIRICWMVATDWPHVAAIEAAVPLGWTLDRISRCTRERNVVGLVAKIDGLVVGHLIYRFRYDGFEVLRLAVDPMARRRGAGSALMAHLIAKTSHRKPNLYATIRESRVDLAYLLAAHGFSSKLVRDGWQEPREDAIRFLRGAPVKTFAELYDGAAVEPFH